MLPLGLSGYLLELHKGTHCLSSASFLAFPAEMGRQPAQGLDIP